MANSDYKQSGASAAFTPIAELAADVDYLDREIPLGRANFPRVDSLTVGMAALCDDEFMRVTGLGPGTVSVTRGSGDTVPAKHSEDALIWFITNNTVGTDFKEHAATTSTSVKYSPYTTGGGALPIDGQSPDLVVYNWRFFRPYPPGQMRVRNQRWYIPQVLSADNPNMRLTWAHRDRLTEADQLIDHDVGNIGPEPGTTYTVRIYGPNGDLRRTEVGIMSKVRDSRGRLIAPSWTYTWQQAMIDLGLDRPTDDSNVVHAKLTLYSTREGFDSWQGYEIKFDVNTQGKFMRVAQQAQLVAQPADPSDSPGPDTGVYVAQGAAMAAQTPSEEDIGGVITQGVYVTQLSEEAGQATSFYTPLNRNLFETPYALMAARGEAPDTSLTTVTARPSDRLTDSHSLWTRYDWPAGVGNAFNYEKVVPSAPFTGWITLATAVSYMDTTFTIEATSFTDGVAINDVLPGQVALVGAEIMRVESVSDTEVIVARGVYDTVPQPHQVNNRMWFFQTHAGNDPTSYPLREPITENSGAAVQVKLVPDVYGPPLPLEDVPTDRVNMKRRVDRPYPPGQVMVNDKRWFSGARAVEDESISITWVHRNRLTQGGDAVDHLAAEVGQEFDQKYRLTIKIWVYPKGADPYEVLIRKAIVDGTSFEYTWEMAKADGYRAGRLLGACGTVTVGLFLETIRDGFNSWQGYTIPLSLPSYACPPGQAPGGGQLPPTIGDGNGDVGTGAPGGSAPGGDNQGDGPKDPIDNGDDGDDGSGPPEPPVPPDEWPDPVDPPPDPDPGEPNPALKAHWDLNWDRHWDAYNKDNQGD